ncbi:MAG: hypothetical protein KKD17_03965 [Nanoarchaeota archaeon]|nr:hypothetical protein [Nanoarchaeota archaeon]
MADQTEHQQEQGLGHKPRHEIRQMPRKPVKIKFTHVAAAVVVILIAWYAYGKLAPEPDYSGLAQCLTEKGAVMYGTYWCSHCKAQKADFGDSFQYINYVECTEEPDACTQAGIRGFPSWTFDSQLYEGRQSFSRLSTLTGCALPEE